MRFLPKIVYSFWTRITGLKKIHFTWNLAKVFFVLGRRSRSSDIVIACQFLKIQSIWFSKNNFANFFKFERIKKLHLWIEHWYVFGSGHRDQSLIYSENLRSVDINLSEISLFENGKVNFEKIAFKDKK